MGLTKLNTPLHISLILALIVIINIFRFYQLDAIPYGFHVDEASSVVGLSCLATEGTGPWGQEKPFFMHMGYGTPKPPVYLWIALPWAKVFGFTIESLRLLSVTVVTVGIIGLFCWVRLIAGLLGACYAALAMSFSPWIWVTSRIAFESLFALVFMIWGLFFLWRRRWWLDSVLAGLLLTAAMYAYPAARLFIPMMLTGVFFYFRWGKLKPLNSIFFVSLILPLLPLIQGILSGELQSRFNEISITAASFWQQKGEPVSALGIIQEFIKNCWLHVSPAFLLFKGDPSYVHSTLTVGIFSWFDLLALAMLVISVVRDKAFLKAHTLLIVFCLVNILLAMVPSALTNEEIPHAVRTSLGLPFLALLVGFSLNEAVKTIRNIPWVNLGVAVIFAGVFLHTYFSVYPQQSKGMFAFWVKEQAVRLKTDEDWLKFMVFNHKLDYHVRYYLMHQKNQSCSQSYTTWKSVGDLMQKMGANP